MTGTLPPARELHVVTDLGSVEVQGNSPRITYMVRKRSYAPTEELARQQFDRMHDCRGEDGRERRDPGQGHQPQHDALRRRVHLAGAATISGLVKVDTRGGSLAFSSISSTIVASTGAGLIKLNDLAGPVKIVSGGGNIEAGNLGNDFTVTSGAADVQGC